MQLYPQDYIKIDFHFETMKLKPDYLIVPYRADFFFSKKFYCLFLCHIICFVKILSALLLSPLRAVLISLYL